MTLMGKKVPAGTGAMPEVGAVHFDENNFEEPYKFNPERFLNDEGNYQKSAMLRPFGVGKRQCLGQILAKKEIQIVLVFLFA